ncbi:glutamyl-tRNA reductase [Vibrio alginolyticus 12G01]|nr:glutamyl-tRNA reductase [Vibrio alginolyticus 12G01]
MLRELSNKLTNKLIHAPTRALQSAAEQGDQQINDYPPNTWLG